MKNLLIAILLISGTAFAQEDKLISILNSDASQKEKVDACRELARVGTRQAVPTLARLLGDEQLSDMARYALEPIPDPSVNTALRDALAKGRGPSLVGIIGSLGFRKDAKAVAPISGFLTHPDPAVAQAAARSLGSIGGSQAAKALKSALSNGSPGVQASVCEGLLRCAETMSAAKAAAIYDRVRTLPNQPSQVRVAALRGAILSRGSKGLPLLIEAIQAETYVTAADAVRISMDMPGAAVTKALIGELSMASPQKQVLLIQALGLRADPAAAPALLPFAQSGSTSLRIPAIRSLVQLSNPSTVPALVVLLKDSDALVSSEALKGLVAFRGKDADAALLALFNDPSPKIRAVAVEAASQRRMFSSVPALLKTTGDTDAQVVNASFNALGALAGVEDIPEIIEAMVKTRSFAQAEAALSEICARQPDPAVCAQQLLPRIANTQGESKLALVRVLPAAGGPNALAAVRAMANDSDPLTKETALRALCDWPTADVLPDLAQISKTAPDNRLKVLALRGQFRLIALESVSNAQKLSQLKEILSLINGKEEQRLAFAALGAVPTVEALNLIMPYVANQDVREEAGTAAVMISEKIVSDHPAEVASAMTQVQAINDKLAARSRPLLAATGFASIFNGTDTTGWKGEPGWWVVEQGALTAESTPEKPCKQCNYLVWDGGQPSNFELLADFKLSAAANSGIQIRSEERPQWDTFGYQADMTGDGGLVGFIYHHQYGLVAGRGEKVVFAADGKKTVERLCDPAQALTLFKQGDWNTYRIVCNGADMSVHLNGVLLCQVTDNRATPPRGIIGLQMHPGPPMKVQFKNLLIKELK